MNSCLFTFKRLLSYGKRYRKVIALAIIMLWFASVSEVSCPIIISYFIDQVLPNRSFDFWNLFGLILIFLVLQLLAATFRYYQALLFNHTALKIIHHIRSDVMKATLYQPIEIFDREPIGKLVSRVTNDTEVIKDLYTTVFSSFLRSITLISSMLLAMFLLDWRLACISLILFPSVLTIMWLYQKIGIPIIRKVRKDIAEMNGHFNEIINGMNVIQQFCQQERFRSELKTMSQDHLDTKMKILKIESWLLRPLFSLLSILILCGLLMIFWVNPHETVKVGILYAFINYLGRLNEPLISLTAQQSILLQSIVAGERVFSLIDSPSQKYGKDERPMVGGRIKLRNLNFSYGRHSSPILKKISMIAKEKSLVALVGQTGSGKSTLANLLMGFYSTKRKVIFLDHRPIETLSQKVLREGVAILQQDPVIVSETIYFNITLGKNFDEKEIWKVLEKVGLASFVRSFPNGIYEKLGENGNTLSSGQKQLLSLARVLIRDPVLLILDEPTANIDYKTEKKISETVYNLKKKTTLLVIAHRLSTISKADQIFVFHHGEIVEYGTHRNLLKEKGKYYKMYQMQRIEQKLGSK